MDYLWSPWRYQYVSREAPRECIFCVKAAEQRDAENFVLARARHNFLLLNLYPYTTGHLMIAPYRHVATLAQADAETLEEMIRLAQLAEAALDEVYRPKGFNVGMNIGECAGAGVAGHIHMHVLPRWPADSNFLTTIGETRVLPEDLGTTYRRLLPPLAAHAPRFELDLKAPRAS
ncbi:MAG: HIT domain-containing protein [Bryobacterales bacterium]|nr:HIT domain-containing protein [Bryobacteraceae bacterium]MDW8129169.1 HIT domain-containing protein [Bryobacterales bacterium]